MQGKADLHTHTTHSDGKYKPEELVKSAVENSISILAITDHDTFTGYFAARDTARELGVQLIPGIELTCDFEGRECHLLGYYFDTADLGFAKFVQNQRIIRRDRMHSILYRLSKMGIEVDIEEVKSEANGGNIGRPHLARTLIKKGYVATFSEAFMRYLSTEKMGHIPSGYVGWENAMEKIKSAGGACILAHPGKFYSEEEVLKFVDAEIDGIECVHPSHRYKEQKWYSELCDKHHLLKTGGSDYHGIAGESSSIFGVVSVKEEFVCKMKMMTDQRKKLNKLK